MSVKLTTKVWNDKSIKGLAERMVMLALADCHNPQKGCFPSLKALQEKTCLSRPGLVRVLDRLTTKGYIEKVAGRGRGQRNNYHLYPGSGLEPGQERVNPVNPLVEELKVERVNPGSQKGIPRLQKGLTPVQETVNVVNPFSLETPQILEAGTVRNRNRTVNTRERASDFFSSVVSSKNGNTDRNGAADPLIPKNLKTPEFSEAWKDYNEHRHKIGPKKWTPLAKKKALKKCEQLGPDKAAEALNNAVMNGWQGFSFEPKETAHQKPEWSPDDFPR